MATAGQIFIPWQMLSTFCDQIMSSWKNYANMKSSELLTARKQEFSNPNFFQQKDQEFQCCLPSQVAETILFRTWKNIHSAHLQVLDQIRRPNNQDGVI